MTNSKNIYIAADFDSDKDAYDILNKWNNDKYLSLTFHNIHEDMQSRDSSLPCSIKESLRRRMSLCEVFVLIVGENTLNVTKGGCQYCRSYNSHNMYCTHGYNEDYRSYVEYECDLAISKGLDIKVFYKSIYVNRNKTFENLRNIGIHIPMYVYKNENLCWNYEDIKNSLR